MKGTKAMGGKEQDWFAELDAELQKQTESISKDLAELNNHKRMINKTLIEDFWKVYMRFQKINVNRICLRDLGKRGEC